MQFTRSKTTEGVQRRPKESSKGPAFGRSKTFDNTGRKSSKSPKRTKSKDGSDPAMIIKRLELLAASDDNAAEEYLQKVKDNKATEPRKSRSLSPKRGVSPKRSSSPKRGVSPKRSSSGKKSNQINAEEAMKMLEKYGCSKDSQEEYLQYLNDSPTKKSRERKTKGAAPTVVA